MALCISFKICACVGKVLSVIRIGNLESACIGEGNQMQLVRYCAERCSVPIIDVPVNGKRPVHPTATEFRIRRDIVEIRTKDALVSGKDLDRD